MSTRNPIRHFLTSLMAALLVGGTLTAHANNCETAANDILHGSSKTKPGLASLKGSYVFSGEHIVNPIAMMDDGVNPTRNLMTCFAVGQVDFDGKGGMQRHAEIFCPTSSEKVAMGLARPAPVGLPDAATIANLGTTIDTEGTYEVCANGWGSLHDEGTIRLGPVSGNPIVTTALFSLGKLGRAGRAREVHVLFKNVSVQPPGASGFVNTDIGFSFVARRRR